MKIFRYYYLILLPIIAATLALNCSNRNHFNINGIINGDFKGYLYLNYNDKKDSCLVTDDTFRFVGVTSDDIVFSSYFSTKGTSAMNRNFFLENKDIEMSIQIENKKIGNTELDWITINSITGTNTSVIEKDYEDFKEMHRKEGDWISRNYKKIDEIISKYPRNQYAAELLSIATSDSIENLHEVQRIYEKLDSSAQNPVTMKHIESRIYSNEIIKIGALLDDFELKNDRNKVIKTKEYRGNILLIDFWASWCGPCRKASPKLLTIASQFNDKRFKILGVSLDQNKSKWLKAIKEDNLIWENVIDTTSFNGKIANNFGILEIPSNILVNEKGIIIAKNLSPTELKAELLQIFDK